MADYILNTIENVVLITFNNVPNSSATLAAIFGAIGKANINVDMISQTAPYKDLINLSFTIDQNDLQSLLHLAKDIKSDVQGLVTEIATGNSKVTLFSELLKTESGIAAKLFAILKDLDVNVKLITTSDVEISLLLDDADLAKTEKALTEAFI